MNTMLRVLVVIYILLCQMTNPLFAIKDSLPLEVLFIGNSYTFYNSLPEMFENLALSSSKNIYVDSYANGGSSLHDHANSGVTHNKIKEKQWDFIILQGTGRRIAYPESFTEEPAYHAIISLKEKINENCAATRIILFMPWADEDGMTWISGWTQDFQEMQVDIYTKTLEYANVLELTISPVGWVWYDVLKELNHPLHYLHQTDWNHPTIKGSYLSACTIFSTIFIENTTSLNYYGGIDSVEAKQFQSKASEIVLDSIDLWNISEYVDTTESEVTHTSLINSELNHDFNLYQNYPNPFDNSTVIPYKIFKQSNVKITLHDALGRPKLVLLNKRLAPGSYSLKLDGGNLVNGCYFYSLISEDSFLVRKMQVIR